MFKPVDDGHFGDATVDISSLRGTNAAGGLAGAVAFPLIQNGGVVTGIDTAFQTGMPTAAGAATGGSVAVGDILVVRGVHYQISAVDSETELKVSAPSSVAGGAPTTNWYIIQKDRRAPQAKNTIYVCWQPPIGLFKHGGHLGSGKYELNLSPNSEYKTACVETKNPNYVVDTSYSLTINDVSFLAYVEKISVPPSVQDIPLLEYQVQSSPWKNQLQFLVSPYTEALTFFIQDKDAGQSALLPPSMFKCLNNSDLRLKSIQVSFAGMTKPNTIWESSFFDGDNKFQQRYQNSYQESGQDLDLVGCESYHDYLQRGPFYHFSFVRDRNFRATMVSVNTTFNGLAGGPTSGLEGTNGSALLYCISHYRTTARVTHADGVAVQSQLIGE